MLDIDRRRQWVARMQRIEAAELVLLAMQAPDRLQAERQSALEAARRRSAIDEQAVIDNALRMTREIEAGKVLFS